MAADVEVPPGTDLLLDAEVLGDPEPEGTETQFPAGFSMTGRGFFYTSADGKQTSWLAAPFEVLGEASGADGQDHGLLLAWRDRNGTRHQWCVPRGMFHRGGGPIAAELERCGLGCATSESCHGLLVRGLQGIQNPRRLKSVSRTGWHEHDGVSVFVLPDGELFGPAAVSVVLQGEAIADGAIYRQAGTLEGWQSEVAERLIGNSRLLLMASAALAGPLLEIAREPSGGFHIVGASRTGKTSGLIVAGSVWGAPAAGGQLRSWRGTGNGLEGVAAAASDTVLTLDEMGQAEPREVGDVVYMLANEAGKARASRAGMARKAAAWRVLFLSTGEVSLAARMGEAGKKITAGLDARLVNIPADAGAGLGVFENLHGASTGAAFADDLRRAAMRHHGVAARAFLAHLAADRAADPGRLTAAVEALRDGFLTRHLPDGATGQVQSVAGRFGLVAAAGELAADYGVLPWPSGAATAAAATCFEAWLAQRGGVGPAEDRQAIAQVRQFLEAHGEARFTLLAREGGIREAADISAPAADARTINRAGFRRLVPGAEGDGERWEFLVLPEAWRNEVCRGLDPVRTARTLADRGLLEMRPEGSKMRPDGKHRIPGLGRPRLFVVSAAILEHDE